MNTIFNVKSLIVGFFALTALNAFSVPKTGIYEIDKVHSNVIFSVDHLGYTKVLGRFNEFEGEVSIGQKKSTLKVEIKAASLDTNHVKRDDHLRSPDFFNVKQFPKILFKSESNSFSDGEKLTGTLELLGVKKDVTFILEKGNEGKDPWGLYRVGYIATGTVKRSDFGMNFMQGGLGDEIKVSVFIEAVKQ